MTDSAGNIKEDEDFYPFGGELQIHNNDSNKYKYGAHELDGETGNYDYGARYYSPAFSRFLTPDWAAKPITVPYADFGNPQSLNLYSYTKNNPTTFGDPDGHFVQNDQQKQPPPIPQYEYKPPPKSAFEQKIANFLNGKGWRTNSEAAAADAQDRAAWDKAHPFMPYPELKIGIVTPTGGVGSGAAETEETVSRLGTSRESAARLGRKAAEAEEKIGVHGVSSTAGNPKGPASSASRSAVEGQFTVHNTPTKSDPFHRTIELPKPVTQAIAYIFNKIFGR